MQQNNNFYYVKIDFMSWRIFDPFGNGFDFGQKYNSKFQEDIENLHRHYEQTNVNWDSPRQKYNDRGWPIYGDKPGDWVQTKEPPEEKKFHPEAGNWEPQWTYMDVVVQERMNGILLLILCTDISMFFTWDEIEKIELKKLTNPLIVIDFIEKLISLKILPTPMEELI